MAVGNGYTPIETYALIGKQVAFVAVPVTMKSEVSVSDALTIAPDVALKVAVAFKLVQAKVIPVSEEVAVKVLAPPIPQNEAVDAATETVGGVVTVKTTGVLKLSQKPSNSETYNVVVVLNAVKYVVDVFDCKAVPPVCAAYQTKIGVGKPVDEATCAVDNCVPHCVALVAIGAVGNVFTVTVTGVVVILHPVLFVIVAV